MKHDLMLRAEMFAALPPEVQQLVKEMYGDDYTFLDCLYALGLSIWSNTDEQRYDAKNEITSEFVRVQGESYNEVAERFTFYVKFIHNNTSIRFPIKGSVSALHTVFDKRLDEFSKSLRMKFEIMRMSHNVDEWSEEKEGSGTPEALCNWVDVIMGFIRHEPITGDSKMQDTNYEKPFANQAAKGKTKPEPTPDPAAPIPTSSPAPAAPGANVAGGEPKDYSRLTCWRCGEVGHPYWKCEKTIGGIKGPGAGGPKWEPSEEDKQKHKKTGETRTVVKTVDADSFFNIFQDREL